MARSPLAGAGIYHLPAEVGGQTTSTNSYALKFDIERERALMEVNHLACRCHILRSTALLALQEPGLV
jgi:hypothetical protein